MAALPLVYWSTGDANAARSAPFTGERCAQAANGCHWVSAGCPIALARLGSAVSMEMMPGCHTPTRRKLSREVSDRLYAIDAT